MPRLIESAKIRRIGQFLADSGYTRPGLQQDLQLTELPWRRLRNRPLMLYKTRAETALAAIARLFYLMQPTAVEALHRVMPAEILALMEVTGLLRIEHDTAVPQSMAMPVEDLVIFSDPITNMEFEVKADMVMFPNATSDAVAAFMLRRPVESALDIGTGSGVLAILVSRFARHVLATDVNEAAVEFARFNAALNGAGNIDFQVGDALGPAAGRKFDLIVANPPFYVSPSKLFTFSNTPMELDGFCAMLAREVPAYLNEGAYFQMMCGWAEIEGQRWPERLAGWFHGSGCDVLGLKMEEATAPQYAQKHLFEANPLHPERDQEVFEEIVRYYADRKVTKIHGGWIALRRRQEKNWAAFYEIPPPINQPFGDLVFQRFEMQDCARLPDEELLDVVLTLVPEVRLRQEMGMKETGWSMLSQTLTLNGSLPASMGADSIVVEMLQKLNGSRTVRQVAVEVATAARIEPAEVTKELPGVIRRLLSGGFLHPDPAHIEAARRDP